MLLCKVLLVAPICAILHAFCKKNMVKAIEFVELMVSMGNFFDIVSYKTGQQCVAVGRRQ
jgi:hypothetical protein